MTTAILWTLCDKGTVATSTLIAHTAFVGCAISFAHAYHVGREDAGCGRVVTSAVLTHISLALSSCEAVVAITKATLSHSPTRAVDQKITVVTIIILIADASPILRARAVARASDVRLLHGSSGRAKLHRAIRPCPQIVTDARWNSVMTRAASMSGTIIGATHCCAIRTSPAEVTSARSICANSTPRTVVDAIYRCTACATPSILAGACSIQTHSVSRAIHR